MGSRDSDCCSKVGRNRRACESGKGGRKKDSHSLIQLSSNQRSLPGAIMMDFRFDSHLSAMSISLCFGWAVTRVKFRSRLSLRFHHLFPAPNPLSLIPTSQHAGIRTSNINSQDEPCLQTCQILDFGRHLNR